MRVLQMYRSLQPGRRRGSRPIPIFQRTDGLRVTLNIERDHSERSWEDIRGHGDVHVHRSYFENNDRSWIVPLAIGGGRGIDRALFRVNQEVTRQADHTSHTHPPKTLPRVSRSCVVLTVPGPL